MQLHLVPENAYFSLLRRAQKHVGEASISGPPDNETARVTPADSHAEQVNRTVLYNFYIERYLVVY